MPILNPPDNEQLLNVSEVTGSQTGTRVLELGGLQDSVAWLAEESAFSPSEELGLSDSNGSFTFDPHLAFDYWKEKLLDVGYARARRVVLIGEELHWRGSGGWNPPPDGIGRTIPPTAPTPAVPLPDDDALTIEFNAFREALAKGILRIPAVDVTGSLEPVERDVGDFESPAPALFIIEVYGITTFLGDAGIGRVVKTMTLLPGESTTLSMRTWRSSQLKIEEASSVLDSDSESAKSRLSDNLEKSTTDKSTRKSKKKWKVSAEVGASWGFGSASIKGSKSGERHSSRESFAKQVRKSVEDHAREASSKRETTVTSSSEVTEKTEDENKIERVISNVNMRRVLTFVFRELIQSFATKVHLKDIRIAYSDGSPDSWRESSIAQLGPLLEKVVKEESVDKVASSIIGECMSIIDNTGRPVPVLELVQASEDGWDEPRLLESQEVPNPPSDELFYRFRSGNLNQMDAQRPVEGVLLEQFDTIMRTDSVIVEALLGQTDALDPYAMEIQAANAATATLENERVRLALTTAREIDDPVERATALAALFPSAAPKTPSPAEEGSGG